MECAAHPKVDAMEVCSICKTPRCNACLRFHVDDQLACSDCGPLAEERGRAIGSAVLGLVGVGYLATLAVGFMIFKARGYVGGLAAVVAIALGRVLQMYLRMPVVTSRK
jgi:hypothetical protein